MPIIKPGDPLLSGFDPNAPLVMPPLFGPVWGGDGNVPGWAKTSWAEANYQQWSRMTGSIVGTIGQRIGVPSWNLSGFGTFFQKMPTVPASQLLSASLGLAAKIVSDSLRDSTTAIPILGWIVQIGLQIYDAVNSAIQMNKKEEPPPGQALVFSSDTNESIAMQLQGMARNMQFQEMFLPPSTSGEWFASAVAWTPGAGRQGWAFGTRDDMGRGLVPGLAQCLGTLVQDNEYINYQFPEFSTNTGQGFGAEFYIPPTSTAGSLAPSSAQLSVLLWQQVMKPSVAMFHIDPYALASAWHDYYMGLAEFAETLKTEKGVENVKKRGSLRTVEFGKNPKLPYNMAAIATTYLPYSSHEDGSVAFASPEYSNWDTSAQIAVAPQGVTIDKLVSVIGSDLTYTYADLVKYVCKIHIERSMASLGTLVCAYVPEGAPLLKASGAHRQRWLEMRKRLLEHDAVMQVELDLIPDAEYRAEVSGKQYTRGLTPAGIGLGAAGKGGKPPVKVKPGDAPTVDGSGSPAMPDSPGPGLPSGRYRPPSSIGGYIGPALAVLAVGALGAIVLRKRR